MLRKTLRMWLDRRKLKRLPSITVNTTLSFHKSFVSPNPIHQSIIHNAVGEQVGTADYAVSPLSDRTYIFDLEIHSNHRRQGYATTFLWSLAQTYGHPITPIKELFSAIRFWIAVRRLEHDKFIVTQQMSISDMDNEAKRWEHLQPQAKLLEKLIAERLSVYNEPWHIATSRGLDDQSV